MRPAVYFSSGDIPDHSEDIGAFHNGRGWFWGDSLHPSHHFKARQRPDRKSGARPYLIKKQQQPLTAQENDA
jgi:hypothetical protein